MPPQQRAFADTGHRRIRGVQQAQSAVGDRERHLCQRRRAASGLASL